MAASKKISELPLATLSNNTDEFVFVQDGITKRAPRNVLLGDVNTNLSTLSSTVGGLSSSIGTLQTDLSSLQGNVGTLQSDLANLPTAILPDGSVDMDAGYVPLNDASIITKGYFNNNVNFGMEVLKGNDLPTSWTTEPDLVNYRYYESTTDSATGLFWFRTFSNLVVQDFTNNTFTSRAYPADYTSGPFAVHNEIFYYFYNGTTLRAYNYNTGSLFQVGVPVMTGIEKMEYLDGYLYIAKSPGLTWSFQSQRISMSDYTVHTMTNLANGKNTGDAMFADYAHNEMYVIIIGKMYKFNKTTLEWDLIRADLPTDGFTNGESSRHGATALGDTVFSFIWNNYDGNYYPYTIDITTDAATGLVQQLEPLSFGMSTVPHMNSEEFVIVADNSRSYRTYSRLTQSAYGLRSVQAPLNYHAAIGDKAFDISSGSAAKTSGALHAYSFAQGTDTVTGADNQVVLGKYNTGGATTLLEVGNGVDELTRSNALEVYSDGTIASPNIDNTLILNRGAKAFITKEYFEANIPAIDVNTVYSNVDTTFSVPVRTSISAEDNAIDFSTNNNFELTATAANITATGMVAGQSGNIIIHTAENVTGWGVEFKFKNVPLDLTGDEIFGYFIDDSLNIWIGRVQ